MFLFLSCSYSFHIPVPFIFLFLSYSYSFHIPRHMSLQKSDFRGLDNVGEFITVHVDRSQEHNPESLFKLFYIRENKLEGDQRLHWQSRERRNHLHRKNSSCCSQKNRSRQVCCVLGCARLRSGEEEGDKILGNTSQFHLLLLACGHSYLAFNGSLWNCDLDSGKCLEILTFLCSIFMGPILLFDFLPPGEEGQGAPILALICSSLGFKFGVLVSWIKSKRIMRRKISHWPKIIVNIKQHV